MSYRDRAEAFELVARQGLVGQQQQQQEQQDTAHTADNSSTGSPLNALKGAVWNTRAVAWIATGRGKRSVRSSLLRPGLFDTTVELPPLSAHSRSLVLHAALHRKLKDASNAGGEIHAEERTLGLDDVAASAEGSEAADLNVLVERALHAAALRGLEEQMCRNNDNNNVDGDDDDDNDDDHSGIPSKNQDNRMILKPQDFAAALEGFVPASLRGVSLTKSDIEWADVGGLSSVREVLKDTLELPMQFQALYERAPQRMASGILLYGPPGCGKTLLAGAVAKECGLNFISVKGPEVRTLLPHVIQITS
jgi:peroxin-1